MAMASDEFLVRLRYWLVSGGMMIRMRLRNDDQPQGLVPAAAPSAWDASVWPLLTPRMPARTISAMKAAV